MSAMIIPQGEQTIMVELTVKEAMALGGARFPQNPQLLLNARRKIRKAVDQELLGERNKAISYDEIAH